MELGAIFLILGVLVIVVIFVAQPFTEHWRVKAQSGHEMSALLAERERALNALQELDFDFGLGKIPTEEYSAQRADLLQRGAEVLRRLDEIQIKQFALAEKPGKLMTEEQPASNFADEELEDLIAKRRALRRQKTGGFCPNCGKPILMSDQFCPACGQALSSRSPQLK
jgi:RNA polymerase-binding transcription factor DksA